MNKDTHNSSYRERIFTHFLVSELMKYCWLKFDEELEITIPDVDSFGFSFVAEHRGVIRHIRVRTSGSNSFTNKQNVHSKLFDKPSGCVVWLVFDKDNLSIEHFRFFGGLAGEPLPSCESFKIASHTKANSDGVKTKRQNIREVNKSQFSTLNTTDELFATLFLSTPEKQLEGDDSLHSEEFTKLDRIARWANNPDQYNSRLVRAFLHLEQSRTIVTFKQLISYCCDNYGGGEGQWNSHFNSMKTDAGHAHGKVFQLHYDKVSIYKEARLEIDKYFSKPAAF